MVDDQGTFTVTYSLRSFSPKIECYGYIFIQGERIPSRHSRAKFNIVRLYHKLKAGREGTGHLIWRYRGRGQ